MLIFYSMAFYQTVFLPLHINRIEIFLSLKSHKNNHLCTKINFHGFHLSYSTACVSYFVHLVGCREGQQRAKKRGRKQSSVGSAELMNLLRPLALCAVSAFGGLYVGCGSCGDLHCGI